MVRIDSARCVKCGDLVLKKNMNKTYLEGCVTKSCLCVNCNTVQALIQRFSVDNNISMYELKNLPAVIMFSDKDEMEIAAASKFRAIVKNYQEACHV